MENKLWTREELILALNLYLKLPFGKMHSRTPEVIKLAGIINRSAGAVAMRLTNFASVDPYHQQRGIKGLMGGIRQVQPVWDEFEHNREELLFESEQILAQLEHQSIEAKYAGILEGIEHLKGGNEDQGSQDAGESGCVPANCAGQLFRPMRSEWYQYPRFVSGQPYHSLVEE